MSRSSIQRSDRVFVKDYGFLSFPKTMMLQKMPLKQQKQLRLCGYSDDHDDNELFLWNG